MTSAVAVVLATLLSVPQAATSQHPSSTEEEAGQRGVEPAKLLFANGSSAGMRSVSGSVHGNPQRILANSLGPLQETERRSGWRKGLIIGGVVGAAVGLVAFLVVDSFPCDSCAGVSDSFADGSGPEFVLGFGLLGAGIGALIGR